MATDQSSPYDLADDPEAMFKNAVADINDTGRPANDHYHLPAAIATAILEQFGTSVRYAYEMATGTGRTFEMTAYDVTCPDGSHQVLLVRDDYDSSRTKQRRLTSITSPGAADRDLLWHAAQPYIREEGSPSPSLQVTTMTDDVAEVLLDPTPREYTGVVRTLLASAATPAVLPIGRPVAPPSPEASADRRQCSGAVGEQL